MFGPSSDNILVRLCVMVCVVLAAPIPAALAQTDDEVTREFELLLLGASAQGNASAVKSIVEAGVDANATDEEAWTPLMHASANGHAEVVDLLLASGADPNRSSKNGATALHLAIAGAGERVVRALIDRGADVDARDARSVSALEAAIVKRSKASVGHLLKAGADPTGASHEGVTPLMRALAVGDAEIIAELRGVGADVAAPRVAQPSIEALSYAVKEGDLRQVQQQIEAGADVNGKIGAGWTPVMIAARWNRVNVLDVLLLAKADVNATNAAGASALHVAATEGHTGIAERLLAAGANTSIPTDRGYTALQFARHDRHADVAELIAQRQGSRSNAELVREVQTLLKLRGFYTGPVDGDYGKNTEKAADSFRWAANIPGRSEIDEKLLQELRSNLDTSGPIGGLWGAVALHRKSVDGFGSWVQKSSEAAEQRAMVQCRKKRSPCELGPVFIDGCFAMGRRGNGWGYGTGSTIDEARRNALDTCKKYNSAGCYLSWGYCSDGSFDLIKFK